jgi:hypothetical protein
MKQELQIVSKKKECRACDLGVFKSGGCECYWYDDTIKVYTCINNACNISYDILHNLVNTVINDKIKKEVAIEQQIRYEHAQQKQKEFNSAFKIASVSDKLAFYGLKKLRILCKRKNIKKYTGCNKEELIILLSPVTTNHDFPIRE